MLQVTGVDLRVFNMRTRLPFRYGIATLRACPHVFVRLTLDVGGKRATGVAADHLPPKWFTKNPTTPFEDEIREMIALIRHAADHAVLVGRRPDLYSFVSAVYAAQSIHARERSLPPLLYNHGVSLVERAAIDALCRAKNTTFANAVHDNLFNVRFSGFADERLLLDYPSLGESQPRQWLPRDPLRSIVARHTVGLLDYLTDDEVPPAERVDDGLPQSFEAAIRAYGLRHFKLKVAGDVDADRERLTRIFAIIEKNVRHRDWGHSIDGNENYKDVAPFRQLWQSLESDDRLKESLARLIFVEQPLHRDVALTENVRAELHAWPDRPPIIIDESDAAPGDLERALVCGYVGTSHKNCKGVIKSIANACLLAQCRQHDPRRTLILSGEDLSNVGPVALLQDLAAAATLGIESLERNGHHYFRGLSMHSPDVQEQILTHHGDLYRQHEAGFPTLDINDGRLQIGSTIDAPFGVAFDLDTTQFTPLRDWQFDPGEQ